MSKSLPSQPGSDSGSEFITPTTQSFRFSDEVMVGLEKFDGGHEFRSAVMDGDVSTVVRLMADGEVFPNFYTTFSVGELVSHAQMYGAETAIEMVRQLLNGGLLRQAIERDLRASASWQTGRIAVSSVEFLDPPDG